MPQIKPRILFVDDDPLLLDALRRAFMRSHKGQWDMSFETSPEQTIEHQKENPFHVVITDLKMPKINGLQLATHLFEIEPATQFVMLTGTADLNTAMDIINNTPIFRFYTKPCPTPDLGKGIEDCLKRFEDMKSPENAGDLIGLHVLDRLQVGVIICEEDSHVVHMNQFAAEICSEQDGLSLDGGNFVRCLSNAARSELQDAIAQGATTESAISIERQSSETSLRVIISSIDDKILILVSDPEKHNPPSVENLQDLYDLAPSEAQLLRLIIQGYSLQEAAPIQGITEGSARTYLKRIFSKTNTSGQPELIRTVLLTPSFKD
ncbi:putative CheY-like receiver [Candidatus Terasakiella magnetica]|uniref:Putative CheY-like receiver n=1 Tax=Candidatus Terasakiella magnetica TaxID=1867952 RepID=A0A1C3RJ19_9PROT|nr:response regulator [Candidatus Terasakiella magnetica]SCA57255.1 putative CheY-like receiver [Candidatus Terasakiella magnetica]